MPVRWYGANVEAATQAVTVGNLHRAGALIQGTAKELCPVKTGNLKSKITYEVDEVELKMREGSNVIYDPFVELGSSRSPAQPHHVPALEANFPAIKEMFHNIKLDTAKAHEIRRATLGAYIERLAG